MVKQAFCYEGPCDLDLWPTNLKINMGLPLLGTNLHIKFQDNRPKRSLALVKQAFCYEGPCDIDLWPTDLKAAVRLCYNKIIAQKYMYA